MVKDFMKSSGNEVFTSITNVTLSKLNSAVEDLTGPMQQRVDETVRVSVLRRATF